MKNSEDDIQFPKLLKASSIKGFYYTEVDFNNFEFNQLEEIASDETLDSTLDNSILANHFIIDENGYNGSLVKTVFLENIMNEHNNLIRANINHAV